MSIPPQVKKTGPGNTRPDCHRLQGSELRDFGLPAAWGSHLLVQAGCSIRGSAAHLCLRRGRDLERGCQRCRRLSQRVRHPFSRRIWERFHQDFQRHCSFFQSGSSVGPAEAEFNLISCNGDYALNVCSMGLDARIAQRPPGISTSPWSQAPAPMGFPLWPTSSRASTGPTASH